MYNENGEIVGDVGNTGYSDEFFSDSRRAGRVKWAFLGVCCLLFITAVIAIPLGLIPVYLNGKFLKIKQ